jgi:hypothetical protein
MRFVFTPPAEAATGLLSLPWQIPLEDWTDSRLVEMRQRGISRHVVRFVAQDGEIYALKEIDERLARKEYRLLRELADLGVPAVEVLGVAVNRGPDLDAVLVTKFLEYSVSYRSLFSNLRGDRPVDSLLDSMVELLVRLHLAGFFWGDCSLSNTLFRMDAGALAAYLVDAETAELHSSLTNGQRSYDVDLASERVGGELFDLEAGGTLPSSVDPLEFVEELSARYERLWNELTKEEVLLPEEQRFRISERLRRLEELGFDVDEVELISAGEGNRLRLKTRVAEPGHYRRLLLARTGLDVQENQARRLWGDMASFRGYLEQKEGRPISEAIAANRWLAEVFDPVMASIPPELSDRLDPVEMFHEILEHRWFLSEVAGHDVGTTAAARSYFATVLPKVPAQLTAGDASSARRVFPQRA